MRPGTTPKGRCPLVGRCAQAGFEIPPFFESRSPKARGVDSFGFDHAGVHGVDPNAARPQFGGQRFSHDISP
jgi:hypothetical protein